MRRINGNHYFVATLLIFLNQVRITSGTDLSSNRFLISHFEINLEDLNSIGMTVEEELDVSTLETQNLIYASRQTPQSLFNSTAIRVGAIPNYDYEVNVKLENGSYTITGGIGFETLKYITEFYNLEIIPIVAYEYASAEMQSNATDIGTKLMSNEFDVIISAHEFNTARLSKFSYLHPHLESRLMGYFVQPPGSSIRDIYHYVFAFNLWIVLLITWITVISVLCGITFVKRITSTAQDNENHSYTDIIFWVLGIACQNGFSMNPESISLKIAILCALLTGLVVYLFYSAAIVSILAWDLGIKDLSDMISSKFKFYCASESNSPKLSNFLWTLTNRAPELKTQVFKMKNSSGFVQALVEEKSVFISLDEEFMQVIRLTNYSLDYLCLRMSTIILDRSPSTLAMMVNKGSPWKEHLNIKLIWGMSNGILNRFRRSHHRLIIPQCLPDFQSRIEIQLGLKDIFSAIVILLILYAASLLCFAAEKSLALRDDRENDQEEYENSTIKENYDIQKNYVDLTDE